jgi:hypothetical protein
MTIVRWYYVGLSLLATVLVGVVFPVEDLGQWMLRLFLFFFTTQPINYEIAEWLRAQYAKRRAQPNPYELIDNKASRL